MAVVGVIAAERRWHQRRKHHAAFVARLVRTFALGTPFLALTGLRDPLLLAFPLRPPRAQQAVASRLFGLALEASAARTVPSFQHPALTAHAAGPLKPPGGTNCFRVSSHSDGLAAGSWTPGHRAAPRARPVAFPWRGHGTRVAPAWSCVGAPPQKDREGGYLGSILLR